MHIAVALTLFIAVCAGAARADPPPPAAQPEASPDIKKPIWVRKITGDDFLRVYLDVIRQIHLSGSATIRCQVNAQGRLDPCAVVAEDPPAQGFGAAALQLATRFQMKPVDRDGAPTAGRSISIPIRFVGAD